MVRCLSGRSRAHAVERAVSSRKRSVAGSNNLTFAAASSSAKGIPARRQQICATEEALSFVISKPAETALARSRKRRTEGDPRISSLEGDRVEVGRSRGATGYSRSLLTRKGAASRQYDEVGAGFDEPGYPRRGFEQVLEVIEHQQEAFLPQVLD